MDRRFSEELLQVISPLGVEASLEALERLSAHRDDRHQALVRQIEQLEYEAKRAFEQYDEVDPRNRLVASQLEQRWNQKLEEVESTRSALSQIDAQTPSLSPKERENILALGRSFSEVWHSQHCPMKLKKKIVRSVIEEVIANLDEEKQRLHFTIHWKGGTHTEFEMDKPRTGAGHKTSLEALEVVRRMAVRYGDDQIASVLNRLDYRTGKGKRWNEHRVATVRRNYSIAGHKRATPDSEILSLSAAAKHCEVSETTIKRLVQSGVLPKEQLVPYAPWEIRRCDLDSEPVCGILVRLRRTGKLVLEGGHSENHRLLFTENKGADNAR